MNSVKSLERIEAKGLETMLLLSKDSKDRKEVLMEFKKENKVLTMSLLNNIDEADQMDLGEHEEIVTIEQMVLARDPSL